MTFPNNAEFAFTVLDDTDDTTILNGPPVYDLLSDLGLRTTKTVWAFDTLESNRGPYFAGETLSSSGYLEWVHSLSARGFEIAFHNATMGTSVREDTIKALNELEAEFGQPIRIHCNHGQNLENLHWGADRYSVFLLRRALSLWSKYRSYPKFEGNNPESPYFWADVADQRLSYIRAFTYRRLNGARTIPGRPYLVRSKQKNARFFNTTDAPDVLAFNKVVNKKSIDKLRDQKGWAIVSTHFGKGFSLDKSLNPDFQRNMEYLASQRGWFVPVSELLDYLAKAHGSGEISLTRNVRMEYSHVIDRFISRLIDQPYYKTLN